jgi:hypothetical protein
MKEIFYMMTTLIIIIIIIITITLTLKEPIFSLQKKTHNIVEMPLMATQKE